MGTIRGRSYPGLQQSGGRWVYRQRIPDKLRPLAREVFNCGHEFTVGLGTNRDSILERYGAATAEVARRLAQLREERARRGLQATTAASMPAAAQPSWMPVNFDACVRSIEAWRKAEVDSAYHAVTNGLIPRASDELGFWDHKRNRDHLLYTLPRLDFRSVGGAESDMPGFTMRLVGVLRDAGHVVGPDQPALRGLAPKFREAWLTVLQAENAWADNIMLGQTPEPAQPSLALAQPPPMPVPVQPPQPPPIADPNVLTRHTTVTELASYYQRRNNVKSEDLDPAMRRFVQSLGGDKAIGEVRRTDIVRFRNLLESIPAHLCKEDRALDLPSLAAKYHAAVNDYLISLRAGTEPRGVKPQADASITKTLSMIRAMFAIAAREGTLDVDPAHGVTAANRKIMVERQPFTNDDLNILFSGPVFTGSASETRQHEPGAEVVGNAAYWLPLIALLSGLRVEEIGQLLTGDVRQVGSVWVFDVAETDVAGRRVKRVKTPSSVRQVPMHPKLIDLGLTDYVATVKAAAHHHLFPDLEGRKEKSGTVKRAALYSSKEFPKVRAVLAPDPRKVFHSFRHTFKADMKRRAINETLQNDLLGHASGAGASASYAKDQRSDLTLRAAVVAETWFACLDQVKRPTTYGAAAGLVKTV